MKRLLTATFIFWFSAAIQAAPFALLPGVSCNQGSPAAGIQLTDVSGNMGGATDCWGAFSGNDNASPTGGFTIGAGPGAGNYDFVAKEDYGSSTSGSIGLVVSAPAQSGTWSFTPGALMGNDFLIVLKQQNSPGYAVWLFADAHAASFSGSWSVAWSNSLSHLSIYKGPKSPPGGQVPVPATLWLFGAGLLAIRILKRRG